VAVGKHKSGWDWIVAFYGRPKVKTACLLLQDKHEVDVTFLLFLCWLDKNGTPLKEHYLTIYANTEGMRKKIRLIRKIRRFFSKIPGLRGLKPRLLALELEKEREFFKRLETEEVLEETPSAAIQAKHYITYQGGLKTAAAKIILRELDA